MDPLLIAVLSFNLRTSGAERGNEHAWNLRGEDCARFVAAQCCDFAGLQEVVWSPEDPSCDQAATMSAIPGYGHVGRARDANAARGEGVMILYRLDRWELDPVEHGTFWLSDTPDVVASRAWDTRCVRTCVWGLFHERDAQGARTGRSVVFANTHLDHGRDRTRLEQAAVVDRFLAGQAALGRDVILTGDFNAYPSEWAYRYLMGETVRVGDSAYVPPLALRDSWREQNPAAPEAATFHGWGEDVPRKRIDYILYAGSALHATAAAIHSADRTHDGKYLSDHHPISAKFTF